jgi:hypothetical protein
MMASGGDGDNRTPSPAFPAEVELRFRSWLTERYDVVSNDGLLHVMDVLNAVPASDEGSLLDLMRAAFAAGYRWRDQ